MIAIAGGFRNAGKASPPTSPGRCLRNETNCDQPMSASVMKIKPTPNAAVHTRARQRRRTIKSIARRPGKSLLMVANASRAPPEAAQRRRWKNAIASIDTAMTTRCTFPFCSVLTVLKDAQII